MNRAELSGQGVKLILDLSGLSGVIWKVKAKLLFRFWPDD
jgi:hypothetical protein